MRSAGTKATISIVRAVGMGRWERSSSLIGMIDPSASS